MHSCEFNYKVYEYCAICDFKSSKYAKIKDLGLNRQYGLPKYHTIFNWFHFIKDGFQSIINGYDSIMIS